MNFVLHLEGNSLVVKGATKVVSTTATQAVVEIGEKCMIFSGENIEVKKLNLDEGEVCLEGVFTNIKIAQAQEKKSLLKRIFK